MSAWADASGNIAGSTSDAGFVYDEHLTMHLYMFENTADDPASRTPGSGFSEPEVDSSAPAAPSTDRLPDKNRIRTHG